MASTKPVVFLLTISVAVVASMYYYYYNNISTRRELDKGMTTVEIFGVKIQRNLPNSKLHDLSISTWPKWGCQPSKFPWTFKATETMYLVDGKVDVSVDGHEGTFRIGAGDLVVFPKGMKIQWDVLEAVNKHYSLDE